MKTRPTLAVLVAAIWVFFSTLPGFAQLDDLDLQTWNDTAERAEVAVENAQASDAVLSDLRTELVGWRTEFSDRRDANSERLATLNAQLVALGAAPEDGALEPAAIAIRRAELVGEIDRLGAPRLVAIEAVTRADGLIGEIDDLLGERTTNALLERETSPLVPGQWSRAFSDFGQTSVGLVAGIQSALANPSSRQAATDQVPLVVLLVILGTLIWYNGSSWLLRLVKPVLRRETEASEGLSRFIVSVGGVVLKLLAAFLFLRGVQAIELYGVRSDVLLDRAPFALGIFLAGLAVLELTRIQFTDRARWSFIGAAGAVSLWLWVQPLAALDQYGGNTNSILGFIFTCIIGLCLWGVGQFLRRWHVHQGEVSSQGDRFTQYVGVAILAVSRLAFASSILRYAAASKDQSILATLT